MKIMIVTDAWSPQVNGVVTTLNKIGEGLKRLGHEVRFVTPMMFRSIPCPTYPEIRLSLMPYSGVKREIESFAPDAIHIQNITPRTTAKKRMTRPARAFWVNDLGFCSAVGISLRSPRVDSP